MLNMHANEIKVSVIIPIYNVEKLIIHCLESLFRQTLKEVEFIFVDDASPDRSIDVLKSFLELYPERRRNVKILYHSHNKGLPAARNTGLKIAQGEYIYHCDSDDFMEFNMLEVLYNSAKQNHADIVWCDWFLSFANKERYMKQPYYKTPVEAIKGMLSGSMKYNVWNKLIHRDVYERSQIVFPSGFSMGEDMTILLLFSHACNVVYVAKAFYHYVKTNTGSLCYRYSDKRWNELKVNASRVIDYMHDKYGKELEQELAFFKLETKFQLLLSGDIKQYKMWKNWYPESNRFILQNKNISLRSRLVQWCAWKNCYFLVKLYSLFLNKIVYHLIYKG